MTVRLKFTILIVVTLARSLPAEEFRLGYLGAEPITLHTTLSYEGKGARLTATATNKSDTTIRHAKICIIAMGWQKECLFTLWNNEPWPPGTELNWNQRSNRHVPGGLGHVASITEFDNSVVVPAAPTPETAPSVDAAMAAPETSGRMLPTSPKIAKLPNLKTGTVLDTQSAKTFLQSGTTTQGISTVNSEGTFSTRALPGVTNGSYSQTTTGYTSAATQIHNITLNEKQLLIVTSEFLYRVNDSVEKAVGFDLYGSVGRAISNRKHGCHVIINDPVQFSQDKGYLNVVDVDGKICKMQIDRQERILPQKTP